MRYESNIERRNLAYDHNMEVANFYNYQYFATLYLGSHLQGMDFIIDTGSDNTWVPNEDCPDNECPMNHYEYHLSNSYKEYGDESKTINYGIGKVEGYIVSDHIALSQSYWAQAKNFTFLSIFHAKGMEQLEMDGLLGLAPPQKKDKSASFFIDELEEDGIIDERMFSIFLAD